jgi:hypothetical protein
MNREFSMRPFLALCILFALAGCEHSVAVLPPGTFSPTDDVEVIPVIQHPMTEIWRPGYWEPRGENDFAWVSGEVVARPAPTAVWKSAMWTRHIYGWTYQEGHWE